MINITNTLADLEAEIQNAVVELHSETVVSDENNALPHSKPEDHEQINDTQAKTSIIGTIPKQSSIVSEHANDTDESEMYTVHSLASNRSQQRAMFKAFILSQADNDASSNTDTKLHQSGNSHDSNNDRIDTSKPTDSKQEVTSFV